MRTFACTIVFYLTLNSAGMPTNFAEGTLVSLAIIGMIMCFLQDIKDFER